MGRPKKKPDVDLSALEHLPKVVEALRHLAKMADEVGALAPRLGLMPQLVRGPNVYPVAEISRETMEASKAAPGDFVKVQLDTPERREYLAELEAKKPKKPVDVSKLPAAQRKAIEMGYMDQIQGEREMKLASMPDGTNEVQKEELKTLARTSDEAGTWGEIKPGPLETAEVA